MDGETLLVVLIAGVIILVIFLCLVCRIKCPKCGSKKIERVSRKFLREETVYFKVQEQIKEYENTGKLWGNAAAGMQYTKPPERVSVRERTLPGTRSYYRVTYRCRDCGKTFSREEYEDKKPIVN